jgi:hypothetical protein
MASARDAERFWTRVFDDEAIAAKLRASNGDSAIETIVAEVVEHRQGTNPSKIHWP